VVVSTSDSDSLSEAIRGPGSISGTTFLLRFEVLCVQSGVRETVGGVGKLFARWNGYGADYSCLASSYSLVRYHMAALPL
jgi:hypothetical protein